MKILIACEFSGIVRDAFIAKGHDAMSCDLLPTERPGPHYQGEVENILEDGWDMMIAHPPCTYLSYAGTAHWNKPGRAEQRTKAMAFFMSLVNAPINKICIENPFGLPCQEYRPPDQIVNPFDFGEPVRKRTCLWLKNLPALIVGRGLWRDLATVPALPPPEPVYVGVRKATGKPKNGYMVEAPTKKRALHWTEAMSYSANRQHERSRFFVGIANAMADQWGDAKAEKVDKTT